MPSRIYTRTGDDGSTGLFGGGRVLKDNARIRAYGTVDELNACLGQCAAYLDEEVPIRSLLVRLQSELFMVGADLATPTESRASVPRLSPADVQRLEDCIDSYETDLLPLTNFILPGGSRVASWLHLARTVCRRAEREIVAARQADTLNVHVLEYINRMSDLLFVLARWVNHVEKVPDVEWIAWREPSSSPIEPE